MALEAGIEMGTSQPLPAPLNLAPQLLKIKLYIPPVRPGHVPRPRLFERLDEGMQHKLTLVSAPAGFGKTTLVSAWLAASKCPAAWISLDAGDNDPARFCRYLIAALQTVAPQVGQGALPLLQSPQSCSLRNVSAASMTSAIGPSLAPLAILSLAARSWA